jgi:hypothetical protein
VGGADTGQSDKGVRMGVESATGGLKKSADNKAPGRRADRIVTGLSRRKMHCSYITLLGIGAETSPVEALIDWGPGTRHGQWRGWPCPRRKLHHRCKPLNPFVDFSTR